FVTPKRRYVGTDTRKIQQLIAENNDERSED
ncbi:thioredoxin domain-containing protein, partial [Enterococcus faecalis]